MLFHHEIYHQTPVALFGKSWMNHPDCALTTPFTGSSPFKFTFIPKIQAISCWKEIQARKGIYCRSGAVFTQL